MKFGDLKWIKILAGICEVAALCFLGASGCILTADDVFLSIYSLLIAFFCLAYAHFLRINHLKENAHVSTSIRAAAAHAHGDLDHHEPPGERRQD